MPHMTDEAKRQIDLGVFPVNGAELNYTFTKAIIEYLRTKGLCYATISDIKGALLGALSEFDNQVVDSYEQLKAAENGNVYQEWSDKVDALWEAHWENFGWNKAVKDAGT
jgi:hypothetical protein